MEASKRPGSIEIVIYPNKNVKKGSIKLCEGAQRKLAHRSDDAGVFEFASEGGDDVMRAGSRGAGGREDQLVGPRVEPQDPGAVRPQAVPPHNTATHWERRAKYQNKSNMIQI